MPLDGDYFGLKFKAKKKGDRNCQHAWEKIDLLSNSLSW